MGRPPAFPPGSPARPARRAALFAARDAALAACAAPLAWPAHAATAGPAAALNVMHGFADQASFSLWLQGRQAAQLDVGWSAVDAPAARPGSLRVTLEAREDWATVARLADLEPGTRYRYAVRPWNQTGGTPLAEGTFTTQALWQWRAEPPAVRLAAGACCYLNDGRFDRPGLPWGGGEGVFDAIVAQQPDLMLWLGDNVYLREPEWTSREGMNRRYRFHREHASLHRLWRSVPHVAIWDDHDFGPNDSDRSFVNKAWSRETFARYWPMPYAAPEGGIYGQVTLGDVDLFLLDDRSYRHPNRWPETPDKGMYGQAQIEWLKGALLTSNASFKIVAGGGQFWNQASRFESLGKFPAEQAELRQWLEARRLKGVIFLSGDRHFGEMLRLERPGQAPLVELTTSPLTAGPVRQVDDAEAANPDLVPGSLVPQRNFAMLTVSGPAQQRELKLALHDTEGKALWEQRLTMADLTPPG